MVKKRITRDEIMCTMAAREIQDGDIVFVGQGYPILGAVVAKKTHAPNAVFVMEGGVVDFEPFRPPTHVAQATPSKGACYFCDLIETFAAHLRAGYIDVGFLGAAQADKYGNINSSYVGDYDQSPMRITGSGGAHEIGCYAGRTLIIMRKGKFVEELDYLTTPGYLEGGDSRERAGLSGGPSALITPKGIFRFEEDSKEMYLASYNPSTTIEEIRADVPWDLKVSPEVARTPIPTDEETAIMRDIGPTIALGLGFTMQVTLDNLMKMSRG
jgi:glutaconate CoA-transferase subunit B